MIHENDFHERENERAGVYGTLVLDESSVRVLEGRMRAVGEVGQSELRCKLGR